MNKDTHDMLARLSVTLAKHQTQWKPDSDILAIQTRADAEALRKISMTLHRWHELECGVEGGGIEQLPNDGKWYWRYAVSGKLSSHPIADREAGAKRRLARIMARYPSLTAYIQTDPRGCALYILKPGDVPAGATVDSCYSRGLTVFK